MAESDSMQEKTEAATPHRREEFRSKGVVAQSRELVIMISLFMLTVTFYIFGQTFLAGCEGIVRGWIVAAADHEHFESNLRIIFQKMFFQGIGVLWPFFLVAFVVGILAHMGQIGVVFSWDPLTPDFSRINPLKGAQRYFSLKGTIETAKSLLKLGVIGSVGYFQFKKFAAQAIKWTSLSVEQQVATGMKEIGSFGLVVIILLIGLAILDYFFQYFEHERGMRMTKQELKEENKMREGDPMIRARIRAIQRDRATKRMMQEVPKADVVVTNPTHFAVALKYDQDTMEAPRVMAKGADYLAQKIKEIARRHNIPIVENKPLARILYRTIKVGKVIPRELYHAVAEVLAYVFKLRRKLRDLNA